MKSFTTFTLYPLLSHVPSHVKQASTALLLSLLTASAAWAQFPSALGALKPVAKAKTETSVASPLDQRVVVFPFNKDGIFDVYTRTQRFTRMEFAPGETVKAFYLSDMIQWEYHIAADKRNILIKPIQPGISTSATVVTNKRSYDLDFTEGRGPWMQRVNWTQPIEDPSMRFFEETSAAAGSGGAAGVSGSVSSRRDLLNAPCNGASLNQQTGYRIESSTAFFAPTHIWDDGRFTCIALPVGVQEIPALFALDSQGQTEIVDYKFLDGILIAPRVLGYGAILKLGKDEVRISGRRPVANSNANVSMNRGEY